MKAKFKDATVGATLWIKDHGEWKAVTVTEVRKGGKGGIPSEFGKIVRLGRRAYVSAPQAHQDADSCCPRFHYAIRFCNVGDQ
jgi:hypothetical protein